MQSALPPATAPSSVRQPGSTEPPVASVIVVATNELGHLRDCLPSLLDLEGPAAEVMVVDNASDDGTGDELACRYPWVTVVRSDRRLGYAEANNLGFANARGDYLVVLNPDTRVDPGFLSGLIDVSKSFDDNAMVTSTVCMYDRPGMLNTVGNRVHFSIIAACRLLESPREVSRRPDLVPSISGCAFLVHRRMLEHMGPFDPTIFPYLEDTELSIRAWLCGFSCVSAPDSVVYHKYNIRMKPNKFFSIERNRLMVFVRTFRWRTIALLAPALLVIELMSWAYAARAGKSHLVAKARSYLSLARHLPGLMRGRKHVQSLRQASDRSILARLDATLPIDQLVGSSGALARAIALVDSLLAAYFSFVRRSIWW
jgi:GT2 family glycosyltransferase